MERAKLLRFITGFEGLRTFPGTIGSGAHSGYGANHYGDVLLEALFSKIIVFRRRI